MGLSHNDDNSYYIHTTKACLSEYHFLALPRPQISSYQLVEFVCRCAYQRVFGFADDIVQNAGQPIPILQLVDDDVPAAVVDLVALLHHNPQHIDDLPQGICVSAPRLVEPQNHVVQNILLDQQPFEVEGVQQLHDGVEAIEGVSLALLL